MELVVYGGNEKQLKGKEKDGVDSLPACNIPVILHNKESVTVSAVIPVYASGK